MSSISYHAPPAIRGIRAGLDWPLGKPVRARSVLARPFYVPFESFSPPYWASTRKGAMALEQWRHSNRTLPGYNFFANRP